MNSIFNWLKRNYVHLQPVLIVILTSLITSYLVNSQWHQNFEVYKVQLALSKKQIDKKFEFTDQILRSVIKLNYEVQKCYTKSDQNNDFKKLHECYSLSQETFEGKLIFGYLYLSTDVYEGLHEYQKAIIKLSKSNSISGPEQLSKELKMLNSILGKTIEKVRLENELNLKRVNLIFHDTNSDF